MSISQFLIHLEELNVQIDVEDNKLNIRAPEGKLTPAVVRELKEKKQEIIDFFQKKVQKQKYTAIEPAAEKEYYSLSCAQKRMYFLQQINLTNTVYNMTQFQTLGKGIDVKKMEDTFKKLIERHESLRTSFHLVENKPVQKIHGEVSFKIEHYREARDFVRPFDLSQAPLMRAGIIETADEGPVLGIDMHHSICDGTSVNILVREFTYMYRQNHPLPPLRIQYKDYTEWQNGEKQKEASKKQEAYWLEAFSGEIPVLEIPTDYPRPYIQSFEGGRLFFKISGKKAAALKKTAIEHSSTLYIMLLVILNILFAKLSGREDIVLGTPTDGRRHADLEGIIGMFVNTLPLRNYPSGEKTFKDFLSEVTRGTLKAFENQDYQFEDLVEKLAVKRDAARSPMFDVMFSWQDIDTGEKTPGESAENEMPQTGASNYRKSLSRFDMNWSGTGSNDLLSFGIEYCTKLFKEETILRFIEFFKKIVSSIIEDPHKKISQIEIITEEEKKRVLYDFNNTEKVYPKEKTIHRLFQEQAAIAGDKIAVNGMGHGTGDSGRFVALTYRELNERSDRLACLLKEKGVESGTIVGISAERSVEMIIGIIGILKAGGVYLPIEFDYPLQRKKYMLADSGARLLLTTTGPAEETDFPGEIICLQNTPPVPTSRSPFPAVGSSDLAYVIYTSGSTGIPKGVLVNHQNVVRLVTNTNFIEFREGERLMQSGALAFDASTFEIWGSLLNGLQLCLVEKETILMPDRLKESIKTHDIAVMWMTSPLFNQLSRLDIDVFSNLGHLIVGGDVLSVKHINRLKREFPRLKISNGYGPTENTTFSTTYLIEKEHNVNIPIGRPITNSTVYIVDRYNRLQPVGVPGELVLGGDGVARGYLNDPELTNSKFQITNHTPPAEGPSLHTPPTPLPLYHSLTSAGTPGPLYRTGDLGRWLSDGNIEFLGRIDNQVKIRGFRVEPGEIESRILEQKDIKEAVVLVHEKDGDKFLCAYIVPGNEFDVSKLKEYLSRKLPLYMIPSYFVPMEQIPLNHNGKIDNGALPVPVHRRENEYVAPTTEVEEKLVELFARVLGKEEEHVGINDSFFDLGGHSLVAVELTTNIHKELNVKISLPDLFTTPTVKGIAALTNVIEWAGKQTVENHRNQNREEILL